MTGTVLLAFAAVTILVVAVLAVVWARTRRVVTTPAERAVHSTLHTASLAARPLRRGLDASSATEAAVHLRMLLAEAQAVALVDADGDPARVGRPVRGPRGPHARGRRARRRGGAAGTGRTP